MSCCYPPFPPPPPILCHFPPCPPVLQVVVLPIFWQQREQERERVLSAAQQAVDLLTEAGVGAVLDNDNDHTPGQRMKFW